MPKSVKPVILRESVKPIIDILIKCFPKGHVDAHYRDGAMFTAHVDNPTWSIFIRDNSSIVHAQQRAIEYLVCYTHLNYKCSYNSYKYFDYMMSGMNALFGTSFTSEEFKMIETLMGGGFNIDTTLRWISSGFDTVWLHKKYELLQAYRNY